MLDQILTARRRQVAAIRARVPLERVQEAAERRYERRDFAGALAARARIGPRIIAELKRSSPSAGSLREDYRPREIAQGYEAAGAAALSVLTEEQFFKGSVTDLIDARDATGLPVLRKDFILDEYQVYESVAAGADALLLIVAALPAPELEHLLNLSNQVGLAALVEAHTAAEVDRAVGLGAKIIGVNNRDLKTLEVTLETSLKLRERIPSNCIAVSESGIRTTQEVSRLQAAGYDAVLVGESLMRADDPGRALSELLGGVRSRQGGGPNN